MIATLGCKPKEEVKSDLLDKLAERYVKLSLHMGKYDPDFIDAYYGPEEWIPDAEEITTSEVAHYYEEIKWEITEAFSILEEISLDELDSMERLRHNFIFKQLVATKTRLHTLMGKSLPFDAEALSLYDASPPKYTAEHFDSLVNLLNQYLPGEGDIVTRYDDFMKGLIIPTEKLDTVFKVAIMEAQKRTSEQLELPAEESFVLEYVTDKAWSGYNWYKGDYQSIIQLNTDLPINIGRAVDLACHEGYPGHHAYNVMLEKNLVNDRGWIEYSVYPLFSPQSLIAEGSANYGIQVVFPENERIKFEKEVLFPLAGLDTALAERYARVREIKSQLNYADNEAARHFINYVFSEEEALDWMMKYSLYSEERAKQRLQFIKKYRSYVINYNLGQDIIKDFVKANAIGSDEWTVFKEILSTPLTASLLSN